MRRNVSSRYLQRLIEYKETQANKRSTQQSEESNDRIATLELRVKAAEEAMLELESQIGTILNGPL